jgi:hypothetical protein
MQPYRGGTRGALVRSGRLVFPFPDKVRTAITHPYELIYKDGRQAVPFADRLMTGVECFMDEMISALETNVPTRFKRP